MQRTLKSHVQPRSALAPRAPFTGASIRRIYDFPPPSSSPIVVGVISMGGFITGTIHPVTGILTGGDINEYWMSIGMTSLPIVKVVFLGNSVFDFTDINAAIENTVDVQMIGACCPTSKLTIILYLANQITYRGDAFYDAFNAAINSTVSVNGIMV